MENRIENGYSNVAPLLERMSRHELKKEVPEPVQVAWNNLSVSLRIGDYLLDTTSDPLTKRSVVIDAMTYLSGDNPELQHGNATYHKQMSGLKDYLSTLPLSRSRQFGFDFRKLIIASGRTASAQRADELLKARYLEGVLTTRLFMDLLPAEYSEIQGFRNYKKTIYRLARIGNVLDSLVDFNDDYASGQTLVTPSFTNKLKLIVGASGQVIIVLKDINKRMLPDLATGVAQAYFRKGSNQLNLEK